MFYLALQSNQQFFIIMIMRIIRRFGDPLGIFSGKLIYFEWLVHIHAAKVQVIIPALTFVEI
jgi:hypothetical protein